MATKLYLRDLTAANPPSNGEKSTALPVGTFKGNSGAGFEDRALKSAIGSAQTSKSIVSLAQTAHQDNYIVRFTSDRLGAQTINANTWTLAVCLAKTVVNANSLLVLSLYVWRPSSTSVVGYIYDSDTTIGAVWGNTEFGQVVTFSGSSVTTQDGDVLVLEVWRHAAQNDVGTYTQIVYFEGATDVTAGQTSDAASYLSTPQTLTFTSPVSNSSVSRQEATASPSSALASRSEDLQSVKSSLDST